MKLQTLVTALLVLAPASLFAQRTPNLSEIVLTKATDNVNYHHFKNAPNATLKGTLADGTKITFDVFITPTYAKQLRSGPTGTGKTLAAEVTAARHIKEAKLTCRKAGGTQWESMARAAKNKESLASMTLVLQDASRSKQEPYLTYVLKDVMISSYSLSGGDTPTASLSLNFTKIEYRTVPLEDK